VVVIVFINVGIKSVYKYKELHTGQRIHV